MVFFGLASKPMVTVLSGLTSKPVATVSPSLSSKPVAQVSQFGPQNRQMWFGDLGLKITASGFSFEPEKQTGYVLSVVAQNRREGIGAGHGSRSSGLLHVEASRAKVFQFALKLAKARRRVVHVASSWRLHRDEAEDG
jgi:hypothetical protein